MKILVVEDNKPISNVICKYLNVAGFEADTAFDGQQAIEKIENGCYDLLLLDVMLPYLNGFDLIKMIDPEKTPVIFLTAKDDLTDKVNGLTLGAEDYITKPFEYEELLARIKVALRRHNKLSSSLTIHGIHIDFDSQQVTKDGKIISLTPKEYDLLYILVTNRKIALSRETLLQKVWGYDFLGDGRTVDVHVQRIRKKLGLQNEIQTVFKTGYRMV